MEPDPREGKLPVWAQQIIQQLRRQLSDRESRIWALTPSQHKDSALIVEPWGENPYHLPTYTRLQFSLTDRDTWQDQITVHLSESSHATKGRVLDVQGGRALIVHPSSANHLYIATNSY